MTPAGKEAPPRKATRALAHEEGPTGPATGIAGEALQASPRMVAQRQRLASVFGPAAQEPAAADAPVAQRVIASRLAGGTHTLGGNPRFESTANFGDRTGRKPLLAIPSTTPHHELHVHLIPVDPPVSYTGWNLKDTRGGGAYVYIDNTTRDIDAEDRALFDAHAAGWSRASSYPADIQWSQPSEASRLAEGEHQFGLRRQKLVDNLTEKLDTYVEGRRKSRPITMTMTFTTFARRRETANQHKERVKSAKSLPQVEHCTATYQIQGDGKVTAKFAFDTYDDFIKGKDSVEAKMKEPISEGRLWTFDSTSDTVAAVEDSIRAPARDYIDAVKRGDRDEVVRNWSGERRDAVFP
jgi:hypothetical protein